jgi:hypothetical protein
MALTTTTAMRARKGVRRRAMRTARRRAMRRASRRATAAERGQGCYYTIIGVLDSNKLQSIRAMFR